MNRTRNKKPAKKTTRRPTVRTLPVRPRPSLAQRSPFITDIQIRAAYTASLAGVSSTLITGWQHQADGTTLYQLPNGAALTYSPYADPPLTALTPCANGHHHPHPVTTPADLREAQHQAITCRPTAVDHEETDRD